MATKFVSERNIKFLLYEVFDVESLTKYEYYSEHNRKMFDMVLKAAVKLGKDLLFPIFEEMDRNPPELGQRRSQSPSGRQDHHERIRRRRLDLQPGPL